ncbi:MAG: AI-2E family transporter [Deltaproteobacteria bacterium]|nr:AI-2E family transporter [Deltaproteobacteria bacterium]
MKRTVKIPAVLILAGFIIVIAGMKAASSILVPFFMAVFIAVICTPPFFWLQRKGGPKILALIAILVIILGVGLLFGALIGPSLNDFLISLPDYQEELSAHIATLISWLREKGVNIDLGGGYIFGPEQCSRQCVSDSAYGRFHPSGGSRFSKEITVCVKKPGEVSVYY